MKKKIDNSVTLQGRLYQHTLERKVSKKGVNYIGGTIDIATDDECLNVVTVNYTYVAPTYPAKDGKPERENPNYATMAKLIDSGKTVVLDGADAATKIRLTPSMAVNDFLSREGQMVAAKRLDGGFVSIVTALPEDQPTNPKNPRNKFEVDVLINNVQDVEPDEERGITEAYVKVNGYTFAWDGSLVPVDFVVKDKGGMDYFSSLEIPTFTNVWGPITNATVVKKVEIASAFGAPVIQEIPRSVKQWEIRGARPEPYEIGSAEEGITGEEINLKLAERKETVARKQKEQEEYAASRAAGAVASPATPAPTASSVTTQSFNW